MSSLEVRYGWESVGDITAGPARSLIWPSMPAGAGVYRFALSLAARTRYYVGETDGYKHRFDHYAKPGPSQITNIRMNARLVTLLHEHGGRAALEVLVDVDVLCDGRPVAFDPHHEVFARRLLENAALVAVIADGGEIINGKGAPPGELWGT